MARIRVSKRKNARTHRDRSIMKYRLINGIRFEPLAEKYDLSVAQVKRIIYKYSDYIFNL